MTKQKQIKGEYDRGIKEGRKQAREEFDKKMKELYRLVSNLIFGDNPMNARSYILRAVRKIKQEMKT